MKEVPNGWSKETVGAMITFSGGSQPPRSTFSMKPREGYIRLIQIRDYKTDKFATYVPIELAKKFCNEDDIMIGRYGPPIFQIFRGISGAYNVALIKATPKDGLSKEYAWHFLKNPYLFHLIESLSQRSSGQTGIEMDALKSYPLPLPPIEEQNAIAGILRWWDRAIDLTERMITEKRALSKGLMQQLVSGKRRFPEFSDSWKTKRMGQLVTPKLRPIPKPEKAYKAMGIRSHFKGTFLKIVENPEKVLMKELYIAKSDDLILNITFAWEGAIAIVPEHHDGLLVSHRFPTYVPNIKEVDPNFLRYLIIQPRFLYLLGLISPGGAGRNRVMSKKDFFGLEFLLPPLNEQRKIGTTIVRVDKEILLLETLHGELLQVKKGLMQKLLTGKVLVKSPVKVTN